MKNGINNKIHNFDKNEKWKFEELNEFKTISFKFEAM